MRLPLTTAAAALFSVQAIGAPILDSDPSAPVTIYLGFSGDTVPMWGGYSNVPVPAWGTDAQITQVWAAVAEMYSPFNVNVSTAPISNTALTHGTNMLIDIGGNGAWTTENIGGISYVGAFSTQFVPNISFVFPSNLSNSPKIVAIAAAHEAGHEFGLEHQSTYNGTTLANEYNPGNSLVAPIMGNAYSSQRALWWDGPSDEQYNVLQDDLRGITSSSNGVTYRSPSGGASMASAERFAGTAAGVITRTTDQDWYSFVADGTTTLNVGVAPYGAMLHSRLDVYDAAGDLVADADAATLGQSVAMDLAAGTYYANVQSFGQYGDIGQYTLTAIQDVPEPALMLVMLVGAAVVLGWRGRKDADSR